jgi:hypothetical protein
MVNVVPGLEKVENFWFTSSFRLFLYVLVSSITLSALSLSCISVDLILTPWVEVLFWEINSRSVSQEIARLIQNPKVHCRVHKSQINPVHVLTSSFSDPHFNVILHLRQSLRSGLLPSKFSDYHFVWIPHFHYACHMSRSSHHTDDFMVQISLKRTAYGVPHYATFSRFLLFPLSQVQIFSSASCSQTPTINVPPLERPGFTPIQNSPTIAGI